MIDRWIDKNDGSVEWKGLRFASILDSDVTTSIRVASVACTGTVTSLQFPSQRYNPDGRTTDKSTFFSTVLYVQHRTLTTGALQYKYRAIWTLKEHSNRTPRIPRMVQWYQVLVPVCIDEIPKYLVLYDWYQVLNYSTYDIWYCSICTVREKLIMGISYQIYISNGEPMIHVASNVPRTTLHGIWSYQTLRPYSILTAKPRKEPLSEFRIAYSWESMPSRKWKSSTAIETQIRWTIVGNAFKIPEIPSTIQIRFHS